MTATQVSEQDRADYMFAGLMRDRLEQAEHEVDGESGCDIESTLDTLDLDELESELEREVRFDNWLEEVYG